MKCPSCRTSHRDRTVCPDCTEPLRPWTLTALAGFYGVVAIVEILGLAFGAGGSILRVLLMLALGWSLYKVKSFAIWFVAIVSIAGIVVGLIGLGIFGSPAGPDGPASSSPLVVLLSFFPTVALLALLAHPASRRAGRLAGSPYRTLVKTVEKENESVEAPPAPHLSTDPRIT